MGSTHGNPHCPCPEPYEILWLEEIMPPDNPEAFARLKAATTVPICQSERIFTRFGFRQIIEQPIADIIMPDVAWGGGITEIRKICNHADTYYLPVTLHDTVGPVMLWASAHLMLHLPNAMIMEGVRGYWAEGGWYNDVVTRPLDIRDGQLTLDAAPGLGVALRPELLASLRCCRAYDNHARSGALALTTRPPHQCHPCICLLVPCLLIKNEVIYEANRCHCPHRLWR
ncbi:MAG: enolase C-terminal domain-like protein [Caldilineaceae bacterium]